MPAEIPISKGARTTVADFLQGNASEVHPGLLLDKYPRSWDSTARPVKWQEHVQRPTLDLVVAASKAPAHLEFKDLYARRQAVLGALASHDDILIEQFATESALTLHLSRASALENAGICLHPIYGFAYLPGSGLKGLARAYAETVWLADNPSIGPAAAWRLIEQVFGWAPRSDEVGPGEIKSWKPKAATRHGKEDAAACGAIIFHDAWPTAWPRLSVDILNNHHPDYYKGACPPGDWENPVPVYFLSLEPKQEFSFAVSRQRKGAVPGESEDLLDLARQWLRGGLAHLGIGAKTNSGYGLFSLKTKPLPTPAYAEEHATLELLSPAFLAGARQGEEDCKLRPATLRGLLRWWWRTLHAGFVSADKLREMEHSIWGSTGQGGAIKVRLVPDVDAPPFVTRFAFKKLGKTKMGKDALFFDPSAAMKHDIEPIEGRFTQGLFYATYGMDEMKVGDVGSRRQRWVVQPGAKWTVSLTARPVKIDAKEISADTVLLQARTALWLLCHFGGCGSKSRKGFGSFDDLPGLTLEACQSAAAEVRKEWGFAGAINPNQTETPSLAQTVPVNPGGRPCLEIRSPWKNSWFVLDQVGEAAQLFAQAPTATGHGKHCATKTALGLPRQIDGPKPKPTKILVGPKGDRHAAPVFYHLARNPQNGLLIVRVIAFISRYLPDRDTSQTVLGQLLAHLQNDLANRCNVHATRGQSSAAQTATGSAAKAPMQIPAANTRVEAVLLSEKTKKGGWMAKYEPHGKPGPIQNSADVPSDKKAEDRVTLIVASANSQTIAFRWPLESDVRPQKKS